MESKVRSAIEDLKRRVRSVLQGNMKTRFISVLGHLRSKVRLVAENLKRWVRSVLGYLKRRVRSVLENMG